uniref:Uncharacterized protein n=1 Tax=Strigamia maritima TaxID=126957 RepID=T1J7L9_STRMM
MPSKYMRMKTMMQNHTEQRHSDFKCSQSEPLNKFFQGAKFRFQHRTKKALTHTDKGKAKRKFSLHTSLTFARRGKLKYVYARSKTPYRKLKTEERNFSSFNEDMLEKSQKYL